ncbi:DUF7289 family protein [Halobaculum sp. D14]|uniref:DUF7289 family protein n=1 Tax=Halobaculum sp. D14 TaxID=3421642 RepID=UPI003EB8F2FC
MDAGDRGQSEVIGVVLLFGLVIATAATVTLLGGMAIQDATQEVTMEQAVLEMRQADSRMSRVAYGRQGGQVVIFGESDSPVRVRKGSSVTITVNDRATCRVEITMGSIVKTVEGSGKVAYEGGGVWRKRNGDVSMVSPPALQYKNGTITFPMVSLANVSIGEVDSLKVTKNVSASRARTRQIRQTFAQPPCNPPRNLTLTVHSQFYKGWGKYLNERMSDDVTYDHANRSVTVSLVRMGGTWAAGDSQVQVDRNFTASVKVLGTELNGRIYDYIQHTPITMSVIVDGDRVTPWAPNAGESVPWAIRHNVNDPDAPEQYTYQFSGSAGANVTVAATSWYGEDYEEADNTTTRNGYTYRQLRPTDTSGKWITVNSSQEGDGNLVILTDGEKLPTWAEAAGYQRNITEIIGQERLYDENGSKHVQLSETQALFIYELSTENANPDDARGSGDPDYNDAVVLFELERADEAENNFFVHVTVSQVRINDGG